MTRSINLIVIHCAASPNGRPQTVADINAWHRARGFHRTPEFRALQNPELDAIGYHFVITLNGAVHTGRHLDEIGAHVQGYNAKSLGVCLIGTDQFTIAQWSSLRYNIKLLQERYPAARIAGHRDLPNVRKTCPGFDVATWLRAEMEPLAGHLLPSAGSGQGAPR